MVEAVNHSSACIQAEDIWHQLAVREGVWTAILRAVVIFPSLAV